MTLVTVFAASRWPRVSLHFRGDIIKDSQAGELAAGDGEKESTLFRMTFGSLEAILWAPVVSRGIVVDLKLTAESFFYGLQTRFQLHAAGRPGSSDSGADARDL